LQPLGKVLLRVLQIDIAEADGLEPEFAAPLTNLRGKFSIVGAIGCHGACQAFSP